MTSYFFGEASYCVTAVTDRDCRDLTVSNGG